MNTLRARQRDDSGVIAVMVALLSVTLFAVGALVVDIGSAYHTRRATQTDADFAALAGAQDLPNAAAARVTAIDYLRRNLPTGENLPLGAWDSDGDPANGEITITNAAGAPATLDGQRIRVVVPPRRVTFGLATVIGFRSTSVDATATASVRGVASSLPYYVTPDVGPQQCWLRKTENDAT
ncbi:MAG: pilus assembly protein TadG-related protein, partial [Mycobacteriales bacterium]